VNHGVNDTERTPAALSIWALCDCGGQLAGRACYVASRQSDVRGAVHKFFTYVLV
jgi:hypothetical protein